MPERLHFIVDPRKVVHETIDGEAILIQFESGNYYSLTGSGAEIWSLLAAGGANDDIVSALSERHAEGEERIRAAVEGLLSELADEDLIEPAEGAPPPPAAPNGRIPQWPSAGEFVPPALEKFTDMQDFLLVDPIHEVDDTGWPYTKNAG